MQDNERANETDLQRDGNDIYVERKLKLSEKERIYLGSESLSSLCEAQLYRILENISNIETIPF